MKTLKERLTQIEYKYLLLPYTQQLATDWLPFEFGTEKFTEAEIRENAPPLAEVQIRDNKFRFVRTVKNMTYASKNK